MASALQNEIRLWSRAEGRRMRDRGARLWKDAQRTPLVQGAILLVAACVLLSSLFVFLFNFFSGVVATLTALLILERIFGLHLRPPTWAV